MSLVVYKYLSATHYIQNGDIKSGCHPHTPVLSASRFPLLFQPTKTAPQRMGERPVFPRSRCPQNSDVTLPGDGRPPHACIYIYPQLRSSSCLHFTFSTALSSVLSEGQRYKVLTVRERKIVFHAVVVDKWLMHR